MKPRERRFIERAIQRRRVFLALSLAGTATGLGLAAYFGWRAWQESSYPLGSRLVIVVLILLNARQNLRQYRYARALDKFSQAARPTAPPPTEAGTVPTQATAHGSNGDDEPG